jgi:hypothetical protein
VGRFFPVAQKASDARILATYASGDAYLVEASRGRGRVLLITTPLDTDWNSIPLTPFYLPFVQSLVRYANPAAPASRNLTPGRPIVINLEEPMDAPTVTRRDEKPERMTLSADQLQASFAATQRPGVYRIELRPKVGPHRLVHFVVQSPRLESDLTPLPPQRWTELERGLGFVRVGQEEDSFTQQIVAARRGHELWLTMLCGALLLGVAELWLARRWSAEGT